MSECCGGEAQLDNKLGFFYSLASGVDRNRLERCGRDGSRVLRMGRERKEKPLVLTHQGFFVTLRPRERLGKVWRGGLFLSLASGVGWQGRETSGKDRGGSKGNGEAQLDIKLGFFYSLVNGMGWMGRVGREKVGNVKEG